MWEICLISWDYTARHSSPHAKCKMAFMGREITGRVYFFPAYFTLRSLSRREGWQSQALKCVCFSSWLFSSKNKDPFCASLKLFHVLSVRLACGDAVTYLLNILPSRNNGPKTQWALEVTWDWKHDYFTEAPFPMWSLELHWDFCPGNCKC